MGRSREAAWPAAADAGSGGKVILTLRGTIPPQHP
jgi:hypothetical protein